MTVEVWTPSSAPDPEPLQTIATRLAIDQAPSGIVLADASLGIVGFELGPSTRHKMWHFADMEQLDSLLKQGWNAAQLPLHILPGVDLPSKENQSGKGAEIELWLQCGVTLSCAHDGEALQVVALAADEDFVRERIAEIIADAGLEIDLAQPQAPR